MNLGNRLFSLAAGSIAGLATRQIVSLVWEKTLHQPVPSGNAEEDIELPLVRVVAFAVVTAGVTALINETLNRQVKKMANKRKA